jgi:endonuclease/exonuclease/phosphatase family metal-dependent hydrolase
MGYGENQTKEIDRLADFVSTQKKGEHYLIMGDFNSLPASPAYDRVLDRLPVRDPFPDAMGVSVAALRERWPTAGFLHLRMRLDHMFAGRGLECVDFEDTHPFGAVEGRWHGLSDHVPIIGRFKVR